MSSNNEDLIQEVLKGFNGVLHSKVPLGHFSQSYDEPYFSNLAQEEAKQVLANFQSSSKLSMEETWAVTNELFPRLQKVIRQWKAKNEGNKTQCDHSLQNQIDFLLNDFKTSVVLKLISAPDVGFQDLETFLEGRKIVLVDIFDNLSKPGKPQSSVDMKTRLDEGLEGVMIEALEKQRIHLEQNITNKAEKVLEDTKRMIMEIAGQLKSQLMAYQGKHPKDLVKGKLEEINYTLSVNGKGLLECHPNIYAAVLRTTAEVRNCLDEDDYKDMSAEEFAETLHEQLLFDFSGENLAEENISSEIDSSSIRLIVGGVCTIPANKNEALTVSRQNEINLLSHRNFQMDFVEEERIKEENNEDEADQDTSGISERNSGMKHGLIESGEIGVNAEEEAENEVEESPTTAVENILKSRWKPSKKSTEHISSLTSASKHSRPKRQCVVVQAKKPKCDEECSGSNSDDSNTYDSNEEGMNPPQKRRLVAPCERNASMLRHAGKRRLKPDGNGKPRTDKITYLHLDKRGRPMYRCQVCDRKCLQSQLKYHGENCGTSDDPLACTECRKTFLNKANLNTHVRIHTGENPFKCSKCTVRFAQKSALRSHLRSHVRGTLLCLYCKACKLSFISQHRLHVHNMSIHKEKLPFGCRYCEKRFDRMTNLKAHVITHADLRPFRCLTCDTMATNSKYVLASHIQTVHSQSRKAALKQANEAAVAYLVRETKDESYYDISGDKINSLVVAHIMKKANLQLPKRATRKPTEHTSNS